ncbi:hypothetical protein B0H16DRAFT_1625176 [Mycena metata]|uniref:Uncharacterized protein n=1 Tax=Mycena metata TaxID=1033252 RepID=A0AAD7H4R4_9AGAR|nr:hypothetical protein B0H16DRAFT_1625176 [Mycena metata]
MRCLRPRQSVTLSLTVLSARPNGSTFDRTRSFPGDAHNPAFSSEARGSSYLHISYESHVRNPSTRTLCFMPPTTTLDAKKPLAPRVRAHKGNVPSLPQTKYCSLCPAKFTRTTHLNRHLRSHTNERLHRCNLCQTAEFTRSDLLTRHQRTCGQSVNRSRRKSCEACAESKIKCNLQLPCAKCTSRGRECVFRNDPEKSRNRVSARGSKHSSHSAEPEEEERSASPTPPASPKISEASSSRTTSTSPSSHFLSLPALSESTSSESNHSSPRSEDFQSFDEQPHTFDFAFDVGGYEGPLVSALPSFDDQSLEVFPRPGGASPNGFLSSGFFDEASRGPGDVGQNCCDSANSDPGFVGVDEEMDLFASLMHSSPHHQQSAKEPQPQPSTSNNYYPAPVPPLIPQPTVRLDRVDELQIQTFRSGLAPASYDRLDTYLHLFFTRFLVQVPLIHGPTWDIPSTPPTLLRIFHACGALFVKTAEASVFVASTLASATAEIGMEFRKLNATPDADHPSAPTSLQLHTTHLIIGLVLLQTVCLFQGENGAREGVKTQPQQPNVEHHAMLVTLIRQTRLIERVRSWKAPDWSDPMLLDAVWREWVRFATLKRALLLAYFHDCCHCMYSASPPAFSPAELDVHLPCDNALWRAQTAAEWFSAAHTPGIYGVGLPRIYGVRMQHAFKALSTSNFNSTDAAMGLRLTPFGLFILIHTVLRNIAVARTARTPPPGGWSCFAMPAVPAPPAPADADADKAEFTFRTQVVLDNWLQLWLTSPETATMGVNAGGGGGGSGSEQEQLPFVCNSLPFHWLAQVSLWENSLDGPWPLGDLGLGAGSESRPDTLSQSGSAMHW